MAVDHRRRGRVARLLMQHRAALYAYIFACVRNHNDAEDVLQNVSVAVVESFDQVVDDSGFLPWAREIARRRILSHHRLCRRERVIDPELAQRLAEAAERVEQARPASVQQAALQACLERLPPRSRRIIAERYEGTAGSIQQLAKRFNRSVQAMYALIKRIKIALRECVERRLVAEV